MKTKLIKFAFAGAIAIMAGINVYNAQKTVVLSDVAKANVEALAEGEGDTDVIVCEGSYLICKQEAEKFYRDLYNNCDVFKGTIEWTDCPNLI